MGVGPFGSGLAGSCTHSEGVQRVQHPHWPSKSKNISSSKTRINNGKVKPQTKSILWVVGFLAISANRDLMDICSLVCRTTDLLVLLLLLVLLVALVVVVAVVVVQGMSAAAAKRPAARTPVHFTPRTAKRARADPLAVQEQIAGTQEAARPSDEATNNAATEEEEEPKPKRDLRPRRPVRPRSAYLFFCAARRQDVVDESPTMSFGQVSHRLACLWRMTPPIEREVCATQCPSNNRQALLLTLLPGHSPTSSGARRTRSGTSAR